jgi:hypothetical protein
MIDEIPIIGVTEWTVDGLAAKEFHRRPKMPLSHRAPSGRGTAEQGGGREEWGSGNLNSWAAGNLIDGAVSSLF